MNQVREFLEYLFNAFKIWVIIQPWETGLIVRNGKRIKQRTKGIYFKLPYFDSVYVQENRLRVTEMPMQTLTSKDTQTITLNSSFGYSISNLQKLYETLYQPEKTLQNIAMSTIAEVVFKNNIGEVSPEVIEQEVLKKLKADDYGIRFEYFRITNFAIVKTFRLIQDQSWISESLNLEKKK